MKIALVSLDQAWENKPENKRKVEGSLKILYDKSVDWVIFPEMTLTGFTMNINECAEDLAHSDSINFFSKQSVEYKINISFGLILKSGDKATNNLITISPDGTIIANYAKIHPFSYAKEDMYYSKGDKLSQTVISNTTVGFSICYDLRFPELFQALSKTCKVIINIANWPKKRVDHWRVLIKARAIENQVFFIGVNRIGTDGNGFEYEKSSMIINPQGDNISEEKINNEISVFTIDPAIADLYQCTFPVKQDRQIDLYKQLL